MSETVVVICFNRNLADVIKRSVGILNAVQNYFHFRIDSDSAELPTPDISQTYSWHLLSSILVREKRRVKAKYFFAVLDHPIENNFFSRTVHDESICFITTKDWEYLSELPLTAFVAYEITENLVEMLIGDIEAHIETRGCLFDMVAIKPHISFKLRTADICTECMLLLNEKLRPSVISAVVSMLEAVRLVALGRAQERVEPSGVLSQAEYIDREFPFPLAYCFRSMQAELTYSRKWLKALELYEVIIKYVSFVLLSALKQQKDQTPVGVTGLRRPSVGHWHAACFGLLSAAKDSSGESFVRRYLEALDRKLIRRSRDASERLLPLRNDTKGHGFIEEEARYQALYEANLCYIQTLMEFVAPLASYTLIKVGEGLRRRRGVSLFPAKILMGSHPIFPVKQHETQEEVDTDCLLYDAESEKYLSLHPWLVIDVCGECHREVVFLYDKLEPGYVVLREYPTNHTQRRDDASELVRSYLRV